MSDQTRLIAIKALHTAIWAFLAASVVAIPIAASLDHLKLAGMLLAIVSVEVAVLALNAGRCPLQRIAGRYTTDRSGNFDIYLPPWLAQRTMIIFGPLLVVGLAIAAVRWLVPWPS